jgi:hypothetical protein
MMRTVKIWKFYAIPATCFVCQKKVRKSRSIRCGGPCECRVGRCCLKWLKESVEERRETKKKFDLDKAFADAEQDSAKLEPWKKAFIRQADNSYSARVAAGHKS